MYYNIKIKFFEVIILSKLYYEYINLKKLNSNKLYLMKSGIFYIALQEDAQKLSDLFDFKITNLNDSTIKCGFPCNRLEFYTNLLKQNNVEFEIIDNNYTKIENYSDYLNNENLKSIINSIITLDMNGITFKQAFNFLNDLQDKLKHVYN